ncbi:cupredoxin domain-containing protein [Demequina mangrovi]|uniref:Cupredoxin-like domain-containing protein n=1 Tax=Demequina mangrovi TaxID=1043493 RepID=A0A1H7AFN9_9MICO|nr:cupredoxin domain-containing protein [Demequina mangrovi]SEJ63756.1 Cupredoxin-like domain-containing protein [Demequina mangrovi]
MRIIRSRAALAATAVALAAALSACGGGEEVPSLDDQPPSAETVLSVSATEYAYSLSSTTVPSGTVAIELTNDGAVSHDLVLEGDPGGATAVIDPGESASFEVVLDPGTYTLYCSVGDHRSRGMEVSFTVT